MPQPKPILLRGATVLTVDADASVHRDCNILVADGKIVALGGSASQHAAELERDGAEIEHLNLRDHFVLPGLIQSHIHLGQTLFRGLAENRRLLRWLSERIWPLEAAHDDDSAYWGTLLGAAECLLSGTTAIQDIGLGPGVSGHLRAIADSGLRANVGMCLMDQGNNLPPGLAGRTDNVLNDTLRCGQAYDGTASGRLRYQLHPRFILSCSDALWTGIHELAADRKWRIHTHALEQREESDQVRELKGGRDEIEYFESVGILDHSCCIAHGVWLNDNHFSHLDRHKFSVAHCPSSNLKLGSGVCDVVKLRKVGLAVGIGADGSPCNNDLDMLEEIRMAALLQQNLCGPGALSAVDALRLATSEGARALGRSDQIGTIEVGKQADLIAISRDRPELFELAGEDPYEQIVYAASRASVDHVMVDGRILVRDGRLTEIDLEQLRQQAAAARIKVLDRATLP